MASCPFLGQRESTGETSNQTSTHETLKYMLGVRSTSSMAEINDLKCFLPLPSFTHEDNNEKQDNESSQFCLQSWNIFSDATNSMIINEKSLDCIGSSSPLLEESVSSDFLISCLESTYSNAEDCGKCEIEHCRNCWTLSYCGEMFTEDSTQGNHSDLQDCNSTSLCCEKLPQYDKRTTLSAKDSNVQGPHTDSLSSLLDSNVFYETSFGSIYLSHRSKEEYKNSDKHIPSPAFEDSPSYNHSTQLKRECQKQPTVNIHFFEALNNHLAPHCDVGTTTSTDKSTCFFPCLSQDWIRVDERDMHYIHDTKDHILTSGISKKQPETQMKNLQTAQNHPLRPLSAYNYFFRDEREKILHSRRSSLSSSSTNNEDHYTIAREDKLLIDHWYQDRTQKRSHRKTHGKISFQKLSKLVSERWNNAPQNVKQFFKNVAARDTARYKYELHLTNA